MSTKEIVQIIIISPTPTVYYKDGSPVPVLTETEEVLLLVVGTSLCLWLVGITIEEVFQMANDFYDANAGW